MKSVFEKTKSIYKIVFFLFMIVMLTSTSVFAEENDVKTVRVGWYQSDMFQEGMDDDQEKSGYCYDYLQKVSNFTRWRYEYVYGDWAELFHMLQNGDIDILGGVSWTEERQESMLFPDAAMGTDQYYLYKHDYDADISITDLSTLSGKKAGGITDNRISSYMERWIEENGVDIEIIYFDSFEEQQEAFEKGEIDLLGQTIFNALEIDGLSIVAKLGEEPFYLAVNKLRDDLTEELNQAVVSMMETYPFILQNLQYDNYGVSNFGKALTVAEQQWISQHETLTVGYYDNYLPYSDKNEEGETVGVVVDVMQGIMDVLELNGSISLQYVAYENYQDMVDSLKQGNIDIAFPVNGNLWQLEQDGICGSAPVISGSETFLYKGTYEADKIHRIAVNKNNGMQIAFSQRVFPQAELYLCDSIEKCLDAVINEEADGTVLNTLRAELVKSDSKYSSLSTLWMQDQEDRCFGIDDTEIELLMLINRGLNHLGTSFAIDNSYKYVSGLQRYDIVDFIKDHLFEVGAAIALFAAVVISILVWNIRRKERYIKEIAELREKAEEASKAKSLFLFNMSHDIRTPMNAIIGYNRLLKKNKDNPEKIEDYSRKIDMSSEFLLSLINSVLEVARIESGNAEIKEEIWSPEQFNDALFSIFEEQMHKKNITFTRNINVVSKYVYCDPVKLREIFLNILSNAYKYTPEGGCVTMRLEELPLEREGYAEFCATITDTGIGISEEFLPHIFEEFTREKTVTDNRIDGTGLGLPIVKNMVDLLGGTIEVRSKQGEGTVVTVTIPLRIAGEPDTHVEEDMENYAGRFAGRRVLLAEDNDLNAEIAEEVFKEIGLEVERAVDGVACVEMLSGAEAGYYDLIFMDIQMPRMNGYEATRKIRTISDKTKAAIPIIAMTANAFSVDTRNAFEAGMNGHLAKPIDIQKLMETLADFLV